MIFADKLITLRKKAGWSQEELAEKLNVTRQSVSKWEGAQSVPDIDKILQLSCLFGVTTDYLLKDDAAEPEYTEDDTSPLPRVTLAQANDYLAKARANAPKLALAAALCVVSPIPLLALGALSEAGLFGIWDDLAGGIGLIALLVIIAAAVAIFMQCSASVRAYEFLQKQAIETEYGVTGLAKECRDAFAPQYDKGNILVMAKVAGQEQPVYGMAAARAGKVVVTLEGIEADAAELSLFHDEDGDYKMKMGERGPAEGYATRKCKLPAEHNTATLKLYYPATENE